ncbi:hypothetical protein SANTM175S_09460 [Streptomyces antimycoticus]
MAWTSGKSRLEITSTVNCPTPGQEKTRSVRIAPPSRLPTSRPNSAVTTGSEALRSPCRSTTFSGPKPLARELRMWSEDSTSISEERSSRATTATE